VTSAEKCFISSIVCFVIGIFNWREQHTVFASY